MAYDPKDLDDQIVAALSAIAFDPSTPAQARVAALKELRDLQNEARDRERAARATEGTDPGTLTLEDINRELSGL